MNNERHFSIQAFDTDGELAPDAHLPEMPAFKTRSRTVGAWTCGVDGRMSLSRYFESLNMAIEEWFEDTLDLPFHELHVGRRVGIPTVQFNTRVAALPEAGANASIWIRPVKVGGRAMTFCSWLVSEGRCLVENEQVVVFVRMLDEGYETMPIPDTIRESFESRLVAAGV
jgi:4-hydroxybenzoyl-CoA thioesterase